MKTRSISRRLIAAVLVLELVSALGLVGITALHEMRLRFHVFHTALHARANALMGAVNDNDEKSNALVFAPAGIPIPTRDIFELKDEENGRVLGRSQQWPAEQLKMAKDEGVIHLKSEGREYHLVRVQGVRMVDSDRPGGGAIQPLPRG